MVIDKRLGSQVFIKSFADKRECVPFTASLGQVDQPPAELMMTCELLDDERGRSTSIRIPPTLSKTYRIGPATIQLLSREDRRLLHTVQLNWTLATKPYLLPLSPLKSTANANQIPRAESVGMQDGILYVASSGYSGANKLWTVDKYRYQSSQNALSKLPNDYLRGAIILGSDRLHLSVVEGKPEGSAYLSHKPEDSSLALTVCPVWEASLKNTDCQSDAAMSLPTGTQALVVSGDRSRIVRADGNGGLLWAGLSEPLAVGGWKSIGAAAAGVRLAMTDLNLDGKSDVVAVWGATGSQQAAAYLATGTGYAIDAKVSMQLTLAMGPKAITALAAGDVDRDGYGDVVFAAEQKLVVLQSQLDKFEPVWSTTVDPDAGKTQIDAIAVGHLEAGIANDKQLDIVTASNSAYDTSNNLTMYLHAFRPMP